MSYFCNSEGNSLQEVDHRYGVVRRSSHRSSISTFPIFFLLQARNVPGASYLEASVDTCVVKKKRILLMARWKENTLRKLSIHEKYLIKSNY